MREIIRQLKKRGVTIFLNSHLLQEVEIVCERVAILNRGVLRYCGPVDQIGKFVGELAGSEGALATSNLVELEISGDDPAAINHCFNGVDFDILSKAGTQFVVRANIGGQTDLDSLIDRLRGSNISIVRLERPRVSLEDAFLKIVDE